MLQNNATHVEHVTTIGYSKFNRRGYKIRSAYPPQSLRLPIILHMDLSTYWSDRLTTRTLVKLPLPSGFDLWLSENYFTPHKDYLPDAQFQWGDIPSNDVLCTVQMSMITVSSHVFYTLRPDSKIQLHEDDFFTDIKAYSLMMYCDVPESSGIDISHLSSPIVTLGHYEGLAGDEDAPIWCRRIDPGYVFEFKQPRLGVAELFFKFGKSTKNYTLKNAILNWATALHVSCGKILLMMYY